MCCTKARCLQSFVLRSPRFLERNPFHRLSRRDAVPKSPLWIWLSDIETAPYCLKSCPKCPYKEKKTYLCGGEECFGSLFGTCWESHILVGMECVCSNLTTSTCSEECPGTKNNPRYLHWLNSTCSRLPDWHGLPNNCAMGMPGETFVWVGNITDWYSY